MPPIPTTIRFAGQVQVPIFTAPYSPTDINLGTQSFYQPSFYPQLTNNAHVNLGAGTFSFDGLFNAVPGLQGIAKIEQAVTGGTNLVDGIYTGQGYETWFNEVNGAALGDLSAISVQFGPEPGDFSGNVAGAFFSHNPYSSAFNDNFISKGFPCFDFPFDNTVVPGFIYNPGSGAGGVNPPINYFAYTFNPVTKTWSRSGLFSLYDWGSVTLSEVTYNQTLSVGGTFGTVYYSYLATSNPSNIPSQLIQSIPSIFNPVVSAGNPNFWTTPSFDNATLQALFAQPQIPANFEIQAFPGGWLVVFITNGSGPTGQLNEVAVLDPAMTQYYLVKFVAQDAGAAAALAPFGSQQPTWQVKIDPNGVMYFATGRVNESHQIFYSYSPTVFPFPQFKYTPSQIHMPCFTPCFPTSSMMGSAPNA